MDLDRARIHVGVILCGEYIVPVLTLRVSKGIVYRLYISIDE